MIRGSGPASRFTPPLFSEILTDHDRKTDQLGASPIPDTLKNAFNPNMVTSFP